MASRPLTTPVITNIFGPIFLVWLYHHLPHLDLNDIRNCLGLYIIGFIPGVRLGVSDLLGRQRRNARRPHNPLIGSGVLVEGVPMGGLFGESMYRGQGQVTVSEIHAH